MAGSAKAETAYRNIGEVAEILDVPQHVLRFWETKFTVLKPLKRAGGRRFYSPQDVALLTELKSLLYQQGYTIKGVQRLLRSARGVASALELTQPEPVEVAVVAATPEDEDGFLKAILLELQQIQGDLTKLAQNSA